jgi:hypothetical protein
MIVKRKVHYKTCIAQSTVVIVTANGNTQVKSVFSVFQRALQIGRSAI